MDKLKLVFTSGGVRAGPIPLADLIIDCRILKEHFPFKTEGGAVFTGPAKGSNPSFQVAMQATNLTELKLIETVIRSGIDAIPSRRGELTDPYSKPFSVLFLCAWGVHRSVSAKHIMAGVFGSEPSFNVEVI